MKLTAADGKQWLAKVGAERIRQMRDPELDIEQAISDKKAIDYVTPKDELPFDKE